MLTGQSAADTTFILLALAFAAVMGVWQAHGRERRAAQLAVEHRRAQRYLDVAGTMIIVLDADGTSSRSTAALRGARLPRTSCIGADWFELAAARGRPRDRPREPSTAASPRTQRPTRSTAGPCSRAPASAATSRGTAASCRRNEGQGMVFAGEDVTEQRAAQERAEYMAFHDALTGLANRAKLEEHLALALAARAPDERALAVLYIDLDHFKVVNDTLGHAAGDELLREVAARLSARCRASDLLARHGGDEFMLLLTDLEGDAPATARAVAERAAGHARDAFQIEGHEFEIAASVGMATFPDDGREMADVLKRADAALYAPRATAAGRSVSPPATGRRATGRLTLTARLRRALARDEFELHYQPVYNVATGEAVAVEALLRWNDPERGMVAARRVHPRRRGQRADRADRRLGRRRRHRPGRRVAARGPAPGHRLQPLPRQLRSPGFADRLLGRFDAAAPTRASSSPRSPSPRPWPTPSAPCRCSTGSRRRPAPRDRRLRRRLLLARPPARPAGARAQDRPLVPARRARRRRASAIVTAIVQLAQALELCAVAEGVEDPSSSRSSPSTAARSPRASTWRGRCPPLR